MTTTKDNSPEGPYTIRWHDGRYVIDGPTPTPGFWSLDECAAQQEADDLNAAYAKGYAAGQKNRWISVEEGLPEKGVTVLVLGPSEHGDGIGLDALDPDSDGNTWIEWNNAHEHYVTCGIPESTVPAKQPHTPTGRQYQVTHDPMNTKQAIREALEVARIDYRSRRDDDHRVNRQHWEDREDKMCNALSLLDKYGEGEVDEVGYVSDCCHDRVYLKADKRGKLTIDVCYECNKECKSIPVYLHPRLAPSKAPAVEAECRKAWDAGFKTCQDYGDNWFHCFGEQRERVWKKYWNVALNSNTDEHEH